MSLSSVSSSIRSSSKCTSLARDGAKKKKKEREMVQIQQDKGLGVGGGEGTQFGWFPFLSSEVKME